MHTSATMPLHKHLAAFALHELAERKLNQIILFAFAFSKTGILPLPPSRAMDEKNPGRSRCTTQNL